MAAKIQPSCLPTSGGPGKNLIYHRRNWPTNAACIEPMWERWSGGAVERNVTLGSLEALAGALDVDVPTLLTHQTF